MEKVRRWMRWLAAAAVVMAATLLVWQCLDAWQTGMAVRESGDALTPVFTAEGVAVRLRRLSAPLAGCALLVVIAAAVHAGPLERPAAMTAANRLRLMKCRVEQLPETAAREERLRRRICLLAGLMLALCGGFVLVYLLDGAHFVSWELEHVMADMLLHVLPWGAAALLTGYAAAAACDRSRLRECAALRGRMTKAPAAAQEQTAALPWVRLALLTAAIVFIVLGVMNGGLLDVLVKAINICTECIGLG